MSSILNELSSLWFALNSACGGLYCTQSITLACAREGLGNREATLELSPWAQVTSHAYYIYKPHINTETTWWLFPALVFCTVASFCYVMFYILFTSNCSVSKLKNSKHVPHKMHFRAEVCRSVPVTLEPESWDFSVGAVHALDCG